MKIFEKIASRVEAIQQAPLTKGNWRKWVLTLLLGGITLVGFGQNVPPSDQYSNNQSITSLIATYPDDVRNAALTVSQYPDILSKLGELHDQTSQKFQNTIQGYSQTKQDWFYELSRYPDLMHNLATLPTDRSKTDIEAIVPTNQGETLKTAAWKLYANHHKDLVAIDMLNQQAEQSFLSLINPLDAPTQAAFQKMIDMPELLSQLSDHLDETTLLGQNYKSNPDAVRQNLDAAAAQNKQDLQAYQQSLAQNPQAMQELQQASQDYANANGYSYPAPTGDKVVNYYNYNPYPYWFGYPYWYSSAMWYPYSFYNSGFYFGLGGYASLYGWPSYGFSNWFFGGAYRYYPNLYRQYNNYYSYNPGRFLRYNNGFMGIARNHFNPSFGRNGYYNPNPRWLGGGGNRYYTNPSRGLNQYGSVSPAPRQNSYSRSYSNTYNVPQSNGGFNRSGGGYSRGSGSFGNSGGGGFSRGGGSIGGGFGGGGHHGGGRR